MRVVQLNAVYEASAGDPVSLLARYSTVVGWAQAMRGAGAEVAVVQRFARDASIVDDGVRYVFVSDGGPVFPEPRWTAPSVVTAVAALEPEAIHVNGMMFPALVAALRAACPRAVIVVQDHAGYGPPGVFARAVDRWQGQVWRSGFAAADAYSFTADARADPWRAAGLIRTQPVLTVVESSTTLGPHDREQAQALTGVTGEPAIVWVGRLEPNKDPLTVLDGLEIAFARMPDARAWMIFQSGTLEADVRRRVERSHALAPRVTLVGRVPHGRIAAYLSAADLYVSGSHDEGSGYALIEAMACGAVPVVTDIPSFRAIAGDCGVFWTAGHGAACAAAVGQAAAVDLAHARLRAAERFAAALRWPAIGERTLALYESLQRHRHAGASS